MVRSSALKNLTPKFLRRDYYLQSDDMVTTFRPVKTKKYNTPTHASRHRMTNESDLSLPTVKYCVKKKNIVHRGRFSGTTKDTYKIKLNVLSRVHIVFPYSCDHLFPRILSRQTIFVVHSVYPLNSTRRSV